MATLTRTRRPGIKLNKWLVVGTALTLLAVAAVLIVTNSMRTTTSTKAVSLATVITGNITHTASGSGSVTANQSVDLAFQASGVVKSITVNEGDTVKAGEALATLDDRDLQAAAASAQASLASAQATLSQKQNGNATAQEIASAQAAVDSAQKAYDEKVAGPSKTDLAWAQAALASAQAAYVSASKDKEAGDSTLRSYKATLDQATVALQKAQSAYDKVAWRSDVGSSTESKDLQDATISYQKALADYDAYQVTSGPSAQSSVASARASVQSAQKALADLQPTAADIAAANATLESAKTTLAGLNSAASTTDIAIAQANVDTAKQSLAQAQLNLAQAILTAPFDGVISTIDIVPGNTMSSSATAMTLINEDPLHVELKLSENDVVQIAKGQTVNLTSDALADWKAQGDVSYVAPSGVTSNGVVTYLVRVDFKNTDPRIKVNMTLNVDIVTAHKENVLLVPNAAILPSGTDYIVQTISADGRTQNVTVKKGLSDGTHTEIMSGLTEGEKIVAVPSSTTSTGNGGGPGGLPGF